MLSAERKRSRELSFERELTNSNGFKKNKMDEKSAFVSSSKGRGGGPSAPRMGMNKKLMSQLPDELKQYINEPSDDVYKHMWHPSTVNMIFATLTAPYAWCKMVLVPKGHIGLSWYGDEPRILGQGRHFLLEPTHRFHRKVELKSNTLIRHGPITIISVAIGEIGIGIDLKLGLPKLLSTGTHFINDDYFKFECFSDITKRITPIGKMQLIRVEKGDVGYGYRGDDGELVIYHPGLHLIQPPDRFVDILSMQIQITQLPKELHESKDYVQIEVRAALYFKIADPVKALTTIEDIHREIKDLGIATLQQIIRSSTLVDISGTSQVSYSQKKDGDKKTAETQQEGQQSDFYARIHDQFMAELHDHILEEWGIDINNIRIESLKIHDKKLAASIANQAVKVSELEAKHMMLSKQTEIINVQANNKAMEMKINVNAEADVIRTQAEAKAQAIISEARAKKEAKILAGQGEAEYSDMVQKNWSGCRARENAAPSTDHWRHKFDRLCPAPAADAQQRCC